jgi:hypothetical protein
MQNLLACKCGNVDQPYTTLDMSHLYSNPAARTDPDYDPDDEDALQDDEYNDEAFLHEVYYLM